MTEMHLDHQHIVTTTVNHTTLKELAANCYILNVCTGNELQEPGNTDRVLCMF